MKPIKLTITSLNSFKDTQVIDFETLTQHGLFGVFGPTGSGKSSILDAMTLALYGKTSRESSNFINVQSDRMQVAFEFKISDQHYEIIRTFRRNKQGAINATKPTKISENQLGEWLVLEEATTELNKKCKSIIGLEFKDFIRTVVLPQGKFSEFIQLKGKDRREMLERLFALSKYGDELSKKLSKYIRNEKDKEIELSGELKGYEDISVQSLKVLQDSNDQLNKEVKELLLQLKAQKDVLQHQEKMMEMQSDYKRTLVELEKLKSEEDLMVQRKIELKHGERILHVKPKYLEVKELTSKFKDLEQANLELKEQHETMGEKHEMAVKSFVDVEADYQLFMKSYEVILHQLKDCLAKSKELADEVNTYDKEVVDYDESVKALSAEKEVLSTLLNQLALDGEQLKILQEKQQALYVSSDDQKYINDGADQEAAYERAIEDQTTQLNNIKSLAVETIEQEVTELKERLVALDSKLKVSSIESTQLYYEQKQSFEQSITSLTSHEKELVDVLSHIESKQQSVLSTKESLEKVKTAFDLYEQHKEKMWISKIKGRLHEGDSCPVCGNEVDQIIDETVDFEENLDLESDIQSLQVQLMTESNDLERLRKEQSTLEATIVSLKVLKSNEQLDLLEKDYLLFKELTDDYEAAAKQLSVKEQQLVLARKQMKVYEASLEKLNLIIEDKDYLLLKEAHPSSFIDAKKKMYEQVKAYEDAKHAVDSARETLSLNEQSVEKKKSLVNQLETSIKLANSQLNVRKEKIEKLKESVEEKDYEQLLTEHQSAYESKENRYKADKELLDQLTNSLTELKEQLSESTGKLMSTKEHLSVAELALKQLLEKHDVLQNEVADSMWTDEKLMKEKNDIEAYDDAINKLKSGLELIKSHLDDTVTPETYEAAHHEHQALTASYESVLKKHIEVQKDIKHIETKLAEMASLIEKRDKIQYKLSLLKDLESLFKGKKFVEFVASYHLRYISVEASKRLFDITSGKYGLEVDEDGMFLVRDYAHGGQTRDMSTLSGGESFLVSLALALSLSSQIQLKGNAPLELFFLDEGFGTLDEQFLELVMSSLEHIHHDKLSIGLISHVDSIKNRVPIKLAVQQSVPGVKGTQVRIERS